jgi:hypothetical protein
MNRSSPTSDRLVRITGIGSAVWGAALLVRGRQVWGLVDHRPPTEADLAAVRFLGARHLAEGVTQAVLPHRFQELYARIDLTHALSMIALAAADERRRRPALASAAVAVGAAVLTLAARRRAAWSDGAPAAVHHPGDAGSRRRRRVRGL